MVYKIEREKIIQICKRLQNDDRDDDDDDVPVFGTVKCCAVEGYQTTCVCVCVWEVTRRR